MREVNFDGLPGPTHTYAALSPGNLAATGHGGAPSNPRAAALQGLGKMALLHSLGVRQAVLPPHPRPDVATLRRLGFSGDDAAVLARAAKDAPALLRAAASASSMWAANAATVAPSRDTPDERLHLMPANLATMFHRSLEAPVTTALLRRVFADGSKFVVHEPLPASALFSDEGAANHTRFSTERSALHLFAWGRSALTPDSAREPLRFPARQSREASAALARLAGLDATQALLWQQAPEGIDGGAFHTDVLAVGAAELLLLHERAFVETEALLATLRERLGETFRFVLATEDELPLADAVRAYPFNSQLVELPEGALALIAPAESAETPRAREYLERVAAEDNRVRSLHFIDVNASMNNGGGPACLRLRVSMTASEEQAVTARVFFDAELERDLTLWVKRHYRDRLTLSDLADPALLDESRAALDALTALLGLGSVYDFQQV